MAVSEHIVSYPPDTGRPKFRRLQRHAATTGLKKVNKEYNLGMSAGEVNLLEMIVNKSSFELPWCWVQTGTQDQWADRWGLSVHSLKKWLRTLKEKEALLSVVTNVDVGLKGAKYDQYDFPVWIVNPVLLDLVEDEFTRDNWISDNRLVVEEMEAFSVHFYKAFEGPKTARFSVSGKCTNSTYWTPFSTSVKCTAQTYRTLFSHTPGLLRKPENPGIAGESPGSDCVVTTRSKERENRGKYIRENDKSTDVVRRRARRRSGRKRAEPKGLKTKSVETLKGPNTLDTGGTLSPVRKPLDTQPDPPAFGADPDSTSSQGEAKAKRGPTPVTQLADHFAAEWTKNQNRAKGGFRQMPSTPWADGSKVAFMGWVKKTLLPEHNHDVELLKQMISIFCAKDFQGARPPWRVFSGQQTKLRQAAYDAGYRTEEEQAKEDAAAAETAARREQWVPQSQERRRLRELEEEAKKAREEAEQKRRLEMSFFEPSDPAFFDPEEVS